ncbi:MAG: ABC transporter ATP-binding protein [Deltaproteobacteria bacterium]|nr:ABC transporter ATP-binding protein [Deltaproteobacteria bacterium]
MSSDTAICFDKVSKVFSKGHNQHGTLREGIMSFFSGKDKPGPLKDNQFFAIKNLSFLVQKGQSIGLYGPNGSGKSTLLKLVANVIAPTRGKVGVTGRIAPLIELGAGFHPDLNGLENIYMNGAILGMTIGEIKSKTDQIIEYSGLSDFISTPVKKYSSGMNLRLGFSIAIHSDADIYLIDEILAVGDEEFKIKSFNSIKDLLEQNKTLLIVSHSMERLSQLTDKIIFLKKQD